MLWRCAGAANESKAMKTTIALLAALGLAGCATPPAPATQQTLVDAAGSLASIAAANNTPYGLAA